MVTAADELQRIRVLEAAAEALALLVEGLRRRSPPRLDEANEYSPEVVQFWLTGGRWRLLTSGAERLGVNVDRAFGTAGNGTTLPVIKADLETAADRLPLLWRSTAWVFRKQERWRVYLDRRAAFAGGPRPQEREPADPVIARAACFERMAAALGWTAAEEIAA